MNFIIIKAGDSEPCSYLRMYVGPTWRVKLVSFGSIAGNRVNDGWCSMILRQTDKARTNQKKRPLG